MARKTSADAETQAMAKAYAALKELPDDAFDRVHSWLRDRYRSDARAAKDKAQPGRLGIATG